MPPHPFPLIRSGGLFLVLVGAALVLGAALPLRRWVLLAIGGGLASIAVALTAASLSIGAPTAC